MKKLFILLLLTSILQSKENIITSILKNIAFGAGQEIGKETVAYFVDKKNKNIESSKKKGFWKPKEGYVWVNPSDNSDSSVIREDSSNHIAKKNIQNLLYVCYDEKISYFFKNKNNLKYQGCTQYASSCSSLSKNRFGKYSSLEDSKQALYRCYSSTPRPLNYYKTKEKSKKLYVCYNQKVKINMNLKYQGCMKYSSSCSTNAKKRFGKYLSVESTEQALGRCQNSTPKFID